MTIGSGGSLSLRNQGSGTIDGSGVGLGSLTFTGNYNTDAAIGGTNSLASIMVADGVNLTLDQNASTTSFIVGQGTSGTVSHSAGIITATTLAVGAGGSFTQSGTGVVNAAMTIGSGGSLSLRNQGSGTIDGSGVGLGSLTFTGNYDTDAALGGTNSLASITVADGANLTLDQDATATFLVVNGTVGHAAGALNASTLTIGNGALFTQAGGSLAAATTILDGGTMRLSSPFSHTGPLTVGAGSSGILDLGGNILNISSDVTMHPGSTLKCTINSDTADDAGRIVAAGQAAVAAGARIDLTVAPATLTLGQRYVIVAGGAGGAVNLPATIIDNIAAYKFVASTDGDALALTVQKAADYLDVARSVTTTSVAAALMAIVDSGAPSADMLSVLAELDNLATEAELDAAMATLAPDTGGLAAASLGVQSQAIGLVDARLDALRPVASAYGSGMATGNPAAGTGVWMQGFANHGVQGMREGVAGFRAHTVGMALGADRELLVQPWTLGVSYAYARSSLDFQETRSGNGTDVTSHLAGLYASWDGGPYFVDLVANAGFNAYETIRQISVGAIRRAARGSFHGRQYSAKVAAGYIMNRQGYAVVPLASLQATHLDLEDYTESGADALNLQVEAQHSDSLQTGLGVRTHFDLKTSDGLFTASLKAMWLYDAVSDPQTVTSAFSGAGGESFSVSAPGEPRHAAELGAGLRFEGNGGFSVVLQYDARIKDAYLGHTAAATLQYRF
jgi:outer membrane autotransporter protein